MAPKAIETHFKGYRFRSRLEARWAILLDALRVKWEYEAEGFDLGEAGRYLPDFWLPLLGAFLEIKGCREGTNGINKARALQERSGKLVAVAFGMPALDMDVEWDGVILRYGTVANSSIYRMLYEGDGGAGRAPDDWGIPLSCPLCHSEYVSVGAPSEETSGDYSAWQGRGGADRLRCGCENGHKWSMRFGFHKGHTYFAIEEVELREQSLLRWLADGDEDAASAAITAARSARFEHGETPHTEA